MQCNGRGKTADLLGLGSDLSLRLRVKVTVWERDKVRFRYRVTVRFRRVDPANAYLIQVHPLHCP